MQNDARVFSRFPYRANAVLIRLPYLYEVTLIDISAHGALVGLRGNVEIRVGDQTRLRVLTEKGNRAFEVEALVAHRSEQLIGVEIGSIDRHALDTLHRLIEMNLGTLDLAARTLPALLREQGEFSREARCPRLPLPQGAGTWPGKASSKRHGRVTLPL
jgi:hypothetical protein